MLACENDGEQVRINVTTASEKNHAGFWIQSSLDKGKIWRNIVFVKSHGDGNSQEVQRYDYVVQSEGSQSADGVVYYRLEQVDYDGAVSYSPIAYLHDCTHSSDHKMTIYPNPASSDDITIRIQAEDDNHTHQVILFNAQGKAVARTSADGSNIVHHDISTLPEGLYFIQLSSVNGQVIGTEKLVIQR